MYCVCENASVTWSERAVLLSKQPVNTRGFFHVRSEFASGESRGHVLICSHFPSRFAPESPLVCLTPQPVRSDLLRPWGATRPAETAFMLSDTASYISALLRGRVDSCDQMDADHNGPAEGDAGRRRSEGGVAQLAFNVQALCVEGRSIRCVHLETDGH